jgi:quinol-cytochrome oxidoreductase complex cytochrome b subunit
MEKKRSIFTRLEEWLRERVDLTELASWFSFTGLIYGPLDKRLNIRDALEKALRKPVPKHVNFYFCFGGITFFLFLIQVVTGVLLSLYYKPSVENAYQSVQYIMNEVSLGWLVREMHAWSANLMILAVFLHMMRVFIYGAYKKPRELNWIVGVLLMMVTLTFGFTGYLLPWDQLAYWASTVGTQIAAEVPVIGKYLLWVMRGGEGVTGATLSRFYAVHVIILPWIMGGLLISHFLMVRRQGISEPL